MATDLWKKSAAATFTAIVTAITLPHAVAAQDTNSASALNPSSKWNVDYGKETCRLARLFGEGEDRHMIFFEQWGPGSDFYFSASGPKFKNFKGGRRTMWQVASGHDPKRTKPLKGSSTGTGPALLYPNLRLEEGQDGAKLDVGDASELDAETAASLRKKLAQPALDTDFASKTEFISLKQGRREVRFATGSLGEAFKVLNDCSASLITEWGLDRQKHKTMTRPAQWLNRSQIARRIIANYPKTALNKGEQAIVQMRVNIDETGKVTQCTIGKATDTQYLNSPACGPMQQAKFAPALDKDGQPMASYYRTSITYVVG